MTAARMPGVNGSRAGDRFRVSRFVDGAVGSYLVDRRGRVREWASPSAAVRALTDAGEDLAAWRVWWRPAGSLGWQVACLASDVMRGFFGR